MDTFTPNKQARICITDSSLHFIAFTHMSNTGIQTKHFCQLFKNMFSEQIKFKLKLNLVYARFGDVIWYMIEQDFYLRKHNCQCYLNWFLIPNRMFSSLSVSQICFSNFLTGLTKMFWLLSSFQLFTLNNKDSLLGQVQNGKEMQHLDFSSIDKLALLVSWLFWQPVNNIQDHELVKPS